MSMSQRNFVKLNIKMQKYPLKLERNFLLLNKKPKQDPSVPSILWVSDPATTRRKLCFNNRRSLAIDEIANFKWHKTISH